VTGPAGPARPAGPAGSTGATGATGPAGLDGTPGAAGEEGSAGPSGATGSPGPAGPTGPAGAKGDAGVTGRTGDTGAVGPAGPSGTPGATGPAGAIGPAGPAGARGDTGPKGDVGSKGDTGAKGDPGPALTSLEQLSGIACEETGTVRLDYDASGKAALTCVTGSTGGGATPLVRINEVETGTSSSGSDEFVELVNAGTAPADIGGWKVVYRSAAGTSDTSLGTIPAGAVLAPGAFYLLGGSSYDGAAAADQSFSAGLAATGGGVGVRDVSGALVDSAGWGTATNALVESSPAAAPPSTAAPGSSIERLPDGHDTNVNSADFTVTSTATPGASNR
jgi:hypothetical protein